MSSKPSILIIDDELEICIFFRRLLEGKGYQVGVATDGDEAEKLWLQNNYQVALVDLKLPDTDGITLLEKIKACQPNCEVIIMTGYATTRTAVKAIQLGASDYIEKPFEDITKVEMLIEEMLVSFNYHKTKRAVPIWADIAEKVGLYYGSNENMHKLLSVAYKIAPKNINVLINGETGTGKEVLARFIHAASLRADQEFVAVNCGAMPENILESHLFGHEKGAFTGANTMHRGIFELANNGTLFLDEIGEASMAIQVKLLRVLETGEFYRVGGEKPIRTNVRFIAATNMDLEKAVLEKTFREDLFYRLDVVRLTLPTLKKREEDILGLVQYFLKRLGVEGKVQVASETLTRLKNYQWPGNLRELYNTISRAVALCGKGPILPAHLPQKVLAPATNPLVSQEDLEETRAEIASDGSLEKTELFSKEMLATSDHFSTPELLEVYKLINKLAGELKNNLVQRGIALDAPSSLKDIEARAIADALTYYEGNITAASKALGVGRNTLYRKLKEYNISIKN